MAELVLIYGMTLEQVRLLQAWWFANGRTIADLDKAHSELIKVRCTLETLETEIVNGPIKLDLQKRVVTCCGSVLDIPNKGMKILEFFMLNKGVVIPTPTVIKKFWGCIDNEAGRQYLRVHLSGLRLAISKILNKDVIKCVTRQGYMMEDLTDMQVTWKS